MDPLCNEEAEIGGRRRGRNRQHFIEFFTREGGHRGTAETIHPLTGQRMSKPGMLLETPGGLQWFTADEAGARAWLKAMYPKRRPQVGLSPTLASEGPTASELAFVGKTQRVRYGHHAGMSRGDLIRLMRKKGRLIAQLNEDHPMRRSLRKQMMNLELDLANVGFDLDPLDDELLRQGDYIAEDLVYQSPFDLDNPDEPVPADLAF